ncbi:PHP domain-containing protein [Desulfosarcina cetonica]
MTVPVRDFHVHSNCSDGLFEPTQLVRHASEAGVQELSLTDHDTIAGLEEAETAARSLEMPFMPGMELTCRFSGRIIHILGYGFETAVAADDAQLADKLASVKQRDHEWAREMCQTSCKNPIVVRSPDGRRHRICIAPEELSWVRGTMPSPFHIAVVLSRKLADVSDELRIPARHCLYLFTGRSEPDRWSESYWPEIRDQYADVLARYSLSSGSYWWTERPTSDLLDAREAIETVIRIGGVPVLAHPGEQKLGDQDIREIADLGIQGVEVYTFKHSPTVVAELETLTKELGLFATSGTDFHDPFHRAQVGLGRDRHGEFLRSGFSIGDFRDLGAYVSGAK